MKWPIKIFKTMPKPKPYPPPPVPKKEPSSVKEWIYWIMQAVKWAGPAGAKEKLLVMEVKYFAAWLQGKKTP